MNELTIEDIINAISYADPLQLKIIEVAITEIKFKKFSNEKFLSEYLNMDLPAKEEEFKEVEGDK